MPDLSVDCDPGVKNAFGKGAQEAGLTLKKYFELLLFEHLVGNPFGYALFVFLLQHSGLVQRAAEATATTPAATQAALLAGASQLRLQAEALWAENRDLAAFGLIQQFSFDFLASAIGLGKLPEVEVELRHDPAPPEVMPQKRPGPHPKTWAAN